MIVEVRKPFMNYVKGQVLEVSEERGTKWIQSRLATAYIEPKPVSKLAELVLPQKPIKEARAIKKRIDSYYENKSKANGGI